MGPPARNGVLILWLNLTFLQLFVFNFHGDIVFCDSDHSLSRLVSAPLAWLTSSTLYPGENSYDEHQ
ncbi:hypothetical protein KPSB59_4620002 [Klebsiella quasipneumoniae subsp. quasipneumoniae]|jgi:hypothetical protein|nr:hypothetical protein KPSB59_4620002 [Klebsiella quasipneumoniae subsp. quasipneumoniae]CDQ15799.1 hypothetical protein KQQSB11_360065 [Klebsiella quasipneumoniae subsp. quasipneumoniae]